MRNNGVVISPSMVLHQVSVQKVQIVTEFKAAVRFEPEAFREYVEDSNPTAYAKIGNKMRLLVGH